jgi:putative heme-binding domain-containing protein
MRAPDLTRGTFKAGNRDDDLFRVISKGVAGSAMPGFEHLGSDQVWGLVRFVRALSRGATPRDGNPVSGESIFWGKGGCGRCHQVGTRGVALGPDLTRGSRRTTADKIRRSIVAPADEIRSDYAVVTIVTRDNQTISGLGRFYDNFSARVIDSAGNERTFLRDEVLSMKREMRTVMPDDYGKILSAAELDDVVAYVMNVRSDNPR